MIRKRTALWLFFCT
ncbi:hemolysin transporter protein shlB, partial [Yersinia pestis PY-52]